MQFSLTLHISSKAQLSKCEFLVYVKYKITVSIYVIRRSKTRDNKQIEKNKEKTLCEWHFY